MNTVKIENGPGLSHHGAILNNSHPLTLAQSATGEQDLAAHSTKTASSIPKKGQQNQFESYEDWKAYIRKSFIEGSGIHPEIFDACVEFHQDIECGLGGDVETPIHDALGWEYRANASCQQDPLILNKLKPSRISRWLLTIIYAIALNL